MMTDEYVRRSSDLAGINLDALIAAENDPGKRTLLLILSSLNKNLMENTKTTESVSVDLSSHLQAFTDHVAADEALLNKGRGAWKILGAALALTQVLISFGLVALMDKMASHDLALTNLQIANVRLEAIVGRAVIAESLLNK